MEFSDDWRSAFPGVTVATHIRDQARAYLDRLPGESGQVAAAIADLAWAPDDFEGVPQPAVDEIRSLFERAGEALDEGDLAGARGLLDDVQAYCTPE